MNLTPREKDKLMIALAALVARGRLARGVKLNYPESVALITDFVMEGARDGKSVAELMSEGCKILTADQVMEGIPEMIHEIASGGNVPRWHQTRSAFTIQFAEWASAIFTNRPNKSARQPCQARQSQASSTTGQAASGPRSPTFMGCSSPANVAAWGWALITFRDSPLLLGTAFLAYSIGVRHASTPTTSRRSTMSRGS